MSYETLISNVEILYDFTLFVPRFLRGDARGAEDRNAGTAVARHVGVEDGDLEARRHRLHRDRGGGVVAR